MEDFCLNGSPRSAAEKRLEWMAPPPPCGVVWGGSPSPPCGVVWGGSPPHPCGGEPREVERGPFKQNVLYGSPRLHNRPRRPIYNLPARPSGPNLQ